VTYTSGSTGVPKGVGRPHRGVLRLVKDGGFVDDRGPRRLPAAGPVSFDASTLEIWGALLNGCRLVLAAPLERRTCTPWAASCASSR
jgi:non-ribosomal peptide synthetase component F